MLKKTLVLVGLVAAMPALAEDFQMMPAEPFNPVAAKAKAEAKVPVVATPVGSWKTGIMRDEAGQFQYCINEGRFSNGMVLVLALNVGGQVNVGLGVPGGQLQPNSDHEFEVKIDDRYSKTLPARAMRPELMVISAGDDKDLVDGLTRGYQVSFKEGSMVSQFSLKGTGAALKSLSDCVKLSAGTVAQPQQVAAAPQPTEQPQAEGLAGSIVAPSEGPTPAAVASPAQEPAPETQAQGTPVVKLEPMAQASAQIPTEAPEIKVANAPEAKLPEVKTLDSSKLPAVKSLSSTPAEQEKPQAQAVAPLPEVVLPPTQTASIEPKAEKSLNQVIEEAAQLPAPTLPAPRPLEQAALPSPLAKLLGQAGIKEAVAIEKASLDAPADFAWTAGNLTGGVRETVAPASATLLDLVEQNLAEATTRCLGQFNAQQSVPEKAGAMQIETARTTCKIGSKTIVTSYVFVLSDKGVLSVLFHQGKNAQALDRASAGLVKALKSRQS